MISPYIISIFVVLGLIIIAMIIWVAYCLTPCYQQTITAKSSFQNTYRYIPYFNSDKLYKLDKIKIIVTGSIKKNQEHLSAIVPSLSLNQILDEQIINQYKNYILLHQVDSFIINDTLLINNLNRYPLDKYPTKENLTTMFFNKLAPILLEKGCQLVQVTLIGDGAKVSHYRHKHRL